MVIIYPDTTIQEVSEILFSDGMKIYEGSTVTLLCAEETTIREFTVPEKWAENWIDDNFQTDDTSGLFGNKVENFFAEYTSDEISQMYAAAILDGVIIDDNCVGYLS